MFKTLTHARAPIAALALAATACSTPSMTTDPLPELTFVHRPTIGLNVATLDIDSAYTSPAGPPNVEQRFPVPPEEALKRWARDRLRALGTAGTSRFTVLTAAVTEEPLPKTKGFLGAFAIEPGSRYTVTIEAQLEVNEGGQRAVASARVSRAQSMDQGASAEERERFWYDLTKSTMDVFDEQMERAIRQHINPWVL